MSIKLNLIAPKKKIEDRELFDGKFVSLMYGVKKYSCYPAALPLIAALTPDDIEIRIIDENIEEINFDEKVDIVGITSNTFQSIRAYEIADEFRKRNVTVVIGGVHATMLPEEAIRHADSVVVGEAENVWKEFINDYRSGKIKKFYRSNEPPNLDILPVPRWELVKNKNYYFHSIQTTRGCPWNCEFCSVKSMYGSRYRYKPIPKVINEIKRALEIEKKLILFADENFIGNKNYTKQLLKEIIPLKLTYFIQTSIDVADDNELLDLLAESGCRKLCIGFESISESNLRQMNKGRCNKIEFYAENIEKLQSYGFEIEGFMIFGYDFDDETIFEKTVNFINETNIIFPILNILTPFPGTKLRDRLLNENRVLHNDWSKYDLSHVCFKPKLMSPETLQNGYHWARQEVFSYENIFKKLKRLWKLWNKNNVRYWDRISPLITNLSMNDVVYSFPKAINPKEFKNKVEFEINSLV